MKLDRNINPDGRGKYALVKLRTKIPDPEDAQQVQRAVNIMMKNNVLDLGNTPDTEFFVIRLKDKYAAPALHAYARAAQEDDLEYAAEISMLAVTAEHHPSQRRPD